MGLELRAEELFLKYLNLLYFVVLFCFLSGVGLGGGNVPFLN